MGRQYPDAEYEALNNSLVRRIGTLNCGHAAFPIIMGVSIPQYSDEQLEKFRTDNENGITYNGKHYTLYEATQRQRNLEASIRKQRRRILIDEAMGDEKKLQTDQIKAQVLKQEYNRFSKAAGLRVQHDRMETVGYNWKQEKAAEKATEAYWEQGYRQVSRGNLETFITKSTTISANEITSYSGVYVSDKATIKRKALHTINKNTEKALAEWGVPADQKPRIVIVSNEEMPTAFGRYDAVTNTVYYVPDVINKYVMAEYGGLAATEYHEMWHARQAVDFRANGWEITEENRRTYIEVLREECKKNIDKLGVNAYNVGEISIYAKKMFFLGAYDEVEAEYMTLNRRGK